MADVTEISAVLNWRSALELAGVGEFPLNVPARATISRRIAKGALQGRHSSIDSALTPARDACEGVLGSGTKSGTRRRR